MLLAATNLSKTFGGVRALVDVSLELRGGEVLALVGENGAGKSTLIKTLTGAHLPEAGEIRLAGKRLERLDPLAARRLGIVAIYQQPALFPDLTVAENIAMAGEANFGWRRIRWKERRARAATLLGRLQARIHPDAIVSELSMPEQQLVEIARAIGEQAQVLILDEPTAALGEEDARRLFEIIEDLKSQGTGILYVSHRLEEIFAIADRVAVLRDGALVANREITAIDKPELVRLMVGRDVTTIYPQRESHPGDIVLELKQLSAEELGLREIDLQVRAGEIVGLAGLVGAGRTELARVIFGLAPASSGAIVLRGRNVEITAPQQAIEHGIAYVPEDRRRHGVILEMNVAANLSLAALRQFSRRGALDWQAERALAWQFVEQLRVKTPSVDTLAGQLSGGNQQKVALGRWLATGPSLLILDEPTQGVDIGAKAEIHRLIGELADRGMAILLISSDLPELLGLSERLAVMHEGSIVAQLDRNDATPEKVLSLALGHVAA